MNRDSEFHLRVPFSRSPHLKGRAVRAAIQQNARLSEWLTQAIEEKLGDGPKAILAPAEANENIHADEAPSIMKTKPLYYIINGNDYLDAYNGQNEWEWTGHRHRAWRMSPARVEAYLPKIKKLFPHAAYSPANKEAKNSPLNLAI